MFYTIIITAMKLKELKPNACYDMVAGKPTAIYKDNDGSWLYRYNIEQWIELGLDDVEEEQQVGWQCREVRVWEQPTKAVIKKAIIRSVVDESTELGIINDYNMHEMGIRANAKAVERYKEYLLFIDELDKMLENLT